MRLWYFIKASAFSTWVVWRLKPPCSIVPRALCACMFACGRSLSSMMVVDDDGSLGSFSPTSVSVRPGHMGHSRPHPEAGSLGSTANLPLASLSCPPLDYIIVKSESLFQCRRVVYLQRDNRTRVQKSSSSLLLLLL